MQTQFAIFVFLALAALVGAAAVALSRNIFWSAMGLLSSLVGVGGMYVLLSADFVAITQLLVYIGGVLVLIIFAVMLTSQIQDVNVSNRSMGIAGGFVVFWVVATLLSFVALWAPWKVTPQPPVEETTAAIGNGLLGKWLLPFEIASVVLVATMIGAIVIARKEVKSDDDGNPGRVPKPSRDAALPAKPADFARDDDGNPGRVPKPSRDAALPAKPADFARD
jgi:NAD(P)H-quinone oxidoreductase subunit 6